MLPTSRRELHPAVVGRDTDVLVDVGAVEHQRIGAVLAFDGVAAVAGIPDEGVVAGAAEQGVVAATAGDDVIAGAADQRVVAVAAGDGVVAVSAVDGELDQVGEAISSGEDVVAAVHVKHEVLGGADVERERRRAETIKANAVAVGRDRKDFGPVAAIDLGGIDAVAAFHQVGTLARVPDHEVVAGLAEHLVVAGAADQRVVAVAAEQKVVAALAFERVVAGAAEQLIIARAADQGVVTCAAEQLHRWHCTVTFVDRYRVVAGLAEHLDRPGVGNRRLAADDGHGAAVDENVAGHIAAGDDGVVEVIVDHRQHAGACGKTGCDCHCNLPFNVYELAQVSVPGSWFRGSSVQIYVVRVFNGSDARERGRRPSKAFRKIRCSGPGRWSPEAT